MVIVIDFDGTLALGDTSNIETMSPNLKLVSLLNQMYKDGNHIKIVTARGCKSCNSFKDREKKYRGVITKWLSKHKICYHELSFYKEYGDIYIDDRGYNIKNNLTYNKLDSKFTNNPVRRFNDCVVKKSTSSPQESLWYKKASELNLDIPSVLSYDVDTLSTSFIDGESCYDVNLILKVLKKFKTTKPTNSVNFNSYIDRIETHLNNNPTIKNGDKLIQLLHTINPPNTFNHGDFSIYNVIQQDSKLYLIDPIYSDTLFQSFVLDAAKHLFSILYYNLNANFFKQCYIKYMDELDLTEAELDILIASESVRVANRKPQLIDISNNLIQSL